MKLFKVFLISLCFLFCENNSKRFVTFFGKITNPSGTEVFIQSMDFNKNIQLSEDDNFSDILTLPINK